jgi:hypothetical protein
MADANYAVVAIPQYVAVQSMVANVFSRTTTSFVIQVGYTSSTSGGFSNFDYGVDFVILGN